MATKKKAELHDFVTHNQEVEPLLQVYVPPQQAEQHFVPPVTLPNNLPIRLQTQEIKDDLTMDGIIIKSTLSDFDPSVQLGNILQAFNKNKDTIMEPSTTLGTRIKRDEFRLVHRKCL